MLLFDNKLLRISSRRYYLFILPVGIGISYGTQVFNTRTCTCTERRRRESIRRRGKRGRRKKKKKKKKGEKKKKEGEERRKKEKKKKFSIFSRDATKTEKFSRFPL